MLEVIAKDLKDIELINKSCADRIELCGAMDQDGLTPELEFVKAAAKLTKVPIRVMVRNHNNGFYFTEDELKEQIEIILALNEIDNIEGYVIGALNQEQTELDIDGMQKLIKAANNRKITCHKAIEAILCEKVIDELVTLGVDTVLTQGGLSPISENSQVLKSIVSYVNKCDYPLEILIGGGVNFQNITTLKKISPCIHVGKIIRHDYNYDKLISVEQIKRIKKM